MNDEDDLTGDFRILVVDEKDVASAIQRMLRADDVVIAAR